MTLALRAVREAIEAPRRTGPVTDAILTMRATMARFDEDPDVRALRRALADRVEADLAVLDVLGGDADEEPSLGASEPLITQWTLTGPDGRPFHPGDQARWAASATDDREEENEHGGNVEDEGEMTALERHGAGFLRSGHDDAEDGHDDEDGHDAEGGNTDDNGIADEDGLADQYGWSQHCRGGIA